MMSDNEIGEKLVFTVPEAGKLLGISRATAYSLAQQGQIPVIRLGKRLVVPKCGLERMLNETRTQPQQHRQEKPTSRTNDLQDNGNIGRIIDRSKAV